MKKSIAIFAACAAAALALVSCQKVNDAPASIEKTVHFTAKSIDTKTVFDAPVGTTYPVIWTVNDANVKISLNLADGKNAAVTPAPGFETATFSAEFTDDASGAYTFYAVSPASACNAFSKSFSSVYVTVPASQTPSATSVDEAAQILVGSSVEEGTMPSSVDLSFGHFTSYGKISFSNITLDGDEDVVSVTLTAEKNWAGAFYYYPLTHTMTEHASAPKSKTITVNTTSLTDVWFACAPVDLSSTTLTVVITTNKGTFTRNIALGDGKEFIGGQIASFTVNMTGIVRVTPELWQNTAIGSISESDVFVITGTKTAGTFALPNDAAAAPGATAVSISTDGSKIEGLVADNLKWNLKKTVIDEVTYYTFYPDGDTDKWLIAKNTNNGVRIVGSSDADADKKYFSMDASGYLKCKDYTRYLCIYNTQDWRTYTSYTSTNAKDQTFAFYVKQ